jgi:hypothetical protein
MPEYSRNIAWRLAKHYILERFGGRTARACGAYIEALIEGIAFVVEPVNKEIVSRILAFKLRLSNPADVEKVYQSVSSSYEQDSLSQP